MQVYQQKGDPVRLLWRRALLFLLTVLVMVGMSSVWRIHTRGEEAATLNQESQAQLADLKKRTDQLKVDIANLSTDRGKEAALRQQYQMGKPGEGVILIIEQKTHVASEPTSTPLTRWIKYVFPWW